MKRKIILTLVLSAMLITGCSKETELIDDFETSGISLTFQETQAAETEGETQYILGGETETSVSANESSAEEAYENMRLIDIEKLNSEIEKGKAEIKIKKCFINGNIICALCGVETEQGHIRDIIRFYNIESEAIEKTIRLNSRYRGEGYEFEEFLGSDDGTLCKLRFIGTGSVWDTYYVITVKNDYSFEYSEYDRQTAALSRGGHNITQWYNDIIDADTEIKIVEGFENDGDGYRVEDVLSQEYMFPIDENRFVYLTNGYEYTPCFGIYDFGNNTAADVPDTEDLTPIGVHGGKIYSAFKPWGKSPSDIYVTDIETLETVKFTDTPAGECYCYKMSESGDKIVYMRGSKEDELRAVLGVIDPDTGDIKEEYKLPYDSGQLYFADNDTVVIIYDAVDKVLIIDLQN